MADPVEQEKLDEILDEAHNIYADGAGPREIVALVVGRLRDDDHLDILPRKGE